MSTYSFRWDSYPQPARNSQVERNGRGVYASIPAHPPALLSGSGSSSAGEKNYKPPRRPKDRCPSSGIAPERRNRWHGATGPLEVEASQDGGELGLLRLPRKHKAPDYPCRGTLCGCWFSAGRLMVWSVTRPPPVVQAQLDTPPCPRPPYLAPEAILCVLALGGVAAPRRIFCRMGQMREFQGVLGASPRLKCVCAIRLSLCA